MEKFDAAIESFPETIALLFLDKSTHEQSIHPLYQLLQCLPVCLWIDQGLSHTVNGARIYVYKHLMPNADNNIIYIDQNLSMQVNILQAQKLVD